MHGSAHRQSNRERRPSSGKMRKGTRFTPRRQPSERTVHPTVNDQRSWTRICPRTVWRGENAGAWFVRNGIVCSPGLRIIENNSSLEEVQDYPERSANLGRSRIPLLSSSCLYWVQDRGCIACPRMSPSRISPPGTVYRKWQSSGISGTLNRV